MKENGEKEWLKKLLNNEPAGEKPEKIEPVVGGEELEDDEEEDDVDDVVDPAVKKEGRMVQTEIRKGGGFADVAGMEWLKQKVTEDFVNVIKHRQCAGVYNIDPVNMLFYGPPGCGKTYFAKKVAEEVGVTFMSVTPDELGSSYIHGSQQKIRAMFDEAVKKAPTIIFLDEIDALVPDRSLDESNHQANETNEFLVLLNESTKRGVFVIGATNNMSRIDKAVTRSGRFDECVYIGLPDKASRESMLRFYLEKRPKADDIDYEALAERTEGFSCSDIDYVIRRAAKEMFNQAVREKMLTGEYVNYPITQAVVENVIATQRPSVSAGDMSKYEKMREKYGFGKSSGSVRKAVGFDI